MKCVNNNDDDDVCDEFMSHKHFITFSLIDSLIQTRNLIKFH